MKLDNSSLISIFMAKKILSVSISNPAARSSGRLSKRRIVSCIVSLLPSMVLSLSISLKPSSPLLGHFSYKRGVASTKYYGESCRKGVILADNIKRENTNIKITDTTRFFVIFEILPLIGAKKKRLPHLTATLCYLSSFFFLEYKNLLIF